MDAPPIPWDIICNQILPRLPVKSLMRFKWVSNSWVSFIRSNYFVAAYANFHRSKEHDPTNFLFLYNKQFYSSQINQHGNPTPITRLSRIPELREIGWPTAQSINGLVCVSRMTWVTVFNPTTNECINVPDAPPASKCLLPAYHFGFDPLNNEFKVLQVATDAGDLRFNIFTLHRDSSWRQLNINLHGLPFDHLSCPFNGRSCDYGRPCPFKGSVYLDGAIHWVHEKDNVIVAFDVAIEEFKVIPMPDTLDSFKGKGVVGVGGCIAMYGFDSECSFVLWILKDYKNHKWVKETLESELIQNTPRGWEIRPLCTIHTGELAVMIKPPCADPWYDYGPASLYLYNMESKHTREEGFAFPDSQERGEEIDDRMYREGCYMLKTTYGNSIVPLK